MNRRHGVPARVRPCGARRTIAALGLAAAGLLGLGRRPAGAQQPGWHSIVEANGNVLFGASSQTLTSLAGSVTHVGDGFSADASVKLRYGESEDADGVKFVNARGWATTLSVDATPKARFSPFVFGAVETSLEKRIADRESGGAGAKYVLARTTTGSASLSLALLGERTAPLGDSALSPERVIRWSWRVKMEQKVADRLSFSHVTFYQPIVDALAQYTITSTSVGSYAINKSVALTLTFTDNYDSQARLRGAPSNNDGSLLFGVRGAF